MASEISLTGGCGTTNTRAFVMMSTFSCLGGRRGLKPVAPLRGCGRFRICEGGVGKQQGVAQAHATPSRAQDDDFVSMLPLERVKTQGRQLRSLVERNNTFQLQIAGQSDTVVGRCRHGSSPASMRIAERH